MLTAASFPLTLMKDATLMLARSVRIAGVALISAGALAVPAVAATPPKQVGTTLNVGSGALGKLHLGQSLSQAKKLLGKPDAQDSQGFTGPASTLNMLFTRYGLDVNFWRGTQGGATKVSSISVSSPMYKTTKGVRVGSPESQIHQAYGRAVTCFSGGPDQPYCVYRTSKVDAKFELRNGRVATITLSK
jgi:hypothetical protein